MKRFTSIIIAFIMLLALATPTQAATRYMSGTFQFGKYAPVVRMRHKVYTSWALQQQSNGTVSWCSKVHEDRESQLFVIIPEGNGYYSFRTFSAPWYVLTYNKSNGKVTMSNPTEPPEYDGGSNQPGKTQKFKIQWKTSVKTAGNRTVKNAYRLICQDGNKIVCFAGWAPFDIQQINA